MKSNKKKDPIIVHNDRGESIRLNKYISESGFCSRRVFLRVSSTGNGMSRRS